MAQDREGNAYSVGDNVWVPCVVTGINTTTGVLTVKNAYSNAAIGNTQDTDTHKPKNFPDR